MVAFCQCWSSRNNSKELAQVWAGLDALTRGNRIDKRSESDLSKLLSPESICFQCCVFGGVFGLGMIRELMTQSLLLCYRQRPTIENAEQRMPSSKSSTFFLISTGVAAGATAALWILNTFRKSTRDTKDPTCSPDLATTDANGEPNGKSTNSKIAVPSAQLVLHLIESRRSFFTKQFSGKAVSSQVIADMLEAARWAPTHHLTQPWHFVVLESTVHRQAAGQLLATLYKEDCEKSGKPFIAAKYEKKQTSALSASHIIAICCNVKTKNPLVEEICSVAMAVQNMHLIATAHDSVGAYWSSSGVYGSLPTAEQPMLGNPPALSEFLGISGYVCLGWFFVGNISHQSSWPQGRRGPCSVSYLS